MLPLCSVKVSVTFTGGYDGNTFLDSVECYDPESDVWSEVTRMTSGRSGVGVAITMEPCQRDQPQCQMSEKECGVASSSSTYHSANSGFDCQHSQRHNMSFGKGT